MTNPRYVILFGVVVIIIGSLLPWATLRSFVGDYDKMGTEGDGVITLGMGLLVGLSALLRTPRPGKRASWLAIIFGVLIGIIAIIDMADVNRLSDDTSFVDINIGIGLYVVAIGALITVVGGWMKMPGELESPLSAASPEFLD